MKIQLVNRAADRTVIGEILLEEFLKPMRERDRRSARALVGWDAVNMFA
jgi:plasmid maintenance system antidote protein VapI